MRACLDVPPSHARALHLLVPVVQTICGLWVSRSYPILSLAQPRIIVSSHSSTRVWAFLIAVIK